MGKRTQRAQLACLLALTVGLASLIPVLSLSSATAAACPPYKGQECIKLLTRPVTQSNHMVSLPPTHPQSGHLMASRSLS